MLGVLGLVGVVIQSDEVETGLQLVAASSEHMLPAYALSRLRVTAAEVDVFLRYDTIKILLIKCAAPAHLLFRAPPWSQSHGLQPSMSLDRPQCSAYRKRSKSGRLCFCCPDEAPV